MNTVTIEGKEKELDSYLATAIAEGFGEGENATAEDQLKAWAYLIRTKLCWSLQGCFGRMASQLIDQDIITIDGIINWDMIDANS